MKKIILIMFILFLAGCSKEKKFIDVEIVEINQYLQTSVIVFEVTNNSDMDLYAKIHFDFVGEGQKTFDTDCWYLVARYEKQHSISVYGEIENARAKIKLCE